jgi:hypothetical protein
MLNIAVLVNTIAVIIGGFFGTFIGNKLTDNIRKILFQSVGLTTIFIGINMGLKANDLIIVLISLAIGGVIGELLKIENRIGKIANKIEKSEGETKFVKGFITATVLFVVGPMTILGSLNAGIGNDNSVLFLKSMLDGISSIILSSVYGIGVIFSALSVWIVQGLFVVGSRQLQFLSQDLYLNDFTAVGGAMIVAISLRLMDIKDIKVGNFLPALVVVIAVNYIKMMF